MASYNDKLNNQPFESYTEYMQYIFDCVNGSLDAYIAKLKVQYANGEGGYKNVFYPDLETAEEACKNRLSRV